MKLENWCKILGDSRFFSPSFPRSVQAGCEPIHFPPVARRCVIQGDLAGQVSIVGGDIVGHFEKRKIHINMCLILNSYRDRAFESNI